MEQHIVEILVFLTKQFPEGAITPDDFEPLTKDLIGLGYTQGEIETALFWFYNRTAMKENSPELSTIETNAFRMLHEIEQNTLTPEAWGYLIELRFLNLISLSEMNIIIERALMLGSKRVTLDEIKTFVAAQIIEQEGQFSLPSYGLYLKTLSEKIQ